MFFSSLSHRRKKFRRHRFFVHWYAYVNTFESFVEFSAGMEVAASTVGKAKSVTVIGRSEVPFARVLGPEIGKAILKVEIKIARFFHKKIPRFQMHIDKGVRFIPNAKVEGFSGNDGNLTGVIVNGETLPAEVCLVGAGKPNNSPTSCAELLNDPRRRSFNWIPKGNRDTPVRRWQYYC